MQITPETLSQLKRDAIAIRRKFLEMHFRAQSGHIGTGLSSIDLLTYVYRVMLGPSDRFILSKGHGASALYATLNHMGQLSDRQLATYYKDDTLLPAHPAAAAFEAIPAATGSLGHGLPIATGLAYAFKHLHGSQKRVVALLSDGECNEGTVWEASLFAGHHKLDNLTVIVDANGLQGFGKTEEVLDMRPFAQKWQSFGYDVREANGHDFGSIHDALGGGYEGALSTPRDGRPLCVIAHTSKGKGVSYMENKLEWHYLPMKEDLYAQAIRDLDAAAAKELGA